MTPKDPFIGQLIKGYRLTHRIGEGGMGRIYLAVHPKIGKQVAIKVLANQSKPDILARFFREAKAVNDIRHENVVDILDIDETEEGAHFLLMEYLEGAPLSHFFRSEGPFPRERIGRVGLQIC